MDLFTSFPEPEPKPEQRKERRRGGIGVSWLLLLLVAGFLGTAAFITRAWLKADSSQAARDVRAGLPEWRIQEMELEAQRAEAQIAHGREAMAADDAKGAYQALVDAKTTAKRYLQRWPTREFRPGVTVRGWFDHLESSYLNDVAAYFDSVIERVKNSDFDVPTADAMTRDFAYYGFPQLRDEWAARHEEIAEARKDAAAKWVRVTFSGNSDAFNGIIRAALVKKWQDRYGFRLVYGDSFDAREDKATWKSIAIRTHLVHASNRILDTREQAISASMPRVPERVEVWFATVGSTEITTTWDELEIFRAVVPVPAQVMLDPLLNQAARDAEGIIADRQQALEKELAKTLEKLPVFELFPEVPSDAPLVDAEERLEMRAAQALIYNRPEKAIEQFTELARDGNSFLREDICRAGISTGSDALAPLIAQILPELDTLKQRRLIGLLKAKPAFGNYAPLLSLLLHPKEGIYPEEAVNALRGHPEAPPVREVFLAKIHDPTTFRRHNYAMVLLQEIPLEEVEILAPAWIASDDDRFALRVFQTVAVRHPALTDRLIRTVFEDVAPTVQYEMLNHLRIDLAKADDATVELFKQNALRKDASLIVDLAYESLAEISRTHRGWKVLRELEAVEKDPNRQQLIKRALMTHVEYLFPETARAFLLEQLKGDHKEARNHAISRLMERKDSKAEILKAIAELIRANPEDDSLIEAAVLGIHQNVRRALGWDFAASSDDLLTILSSAVRHWNVQIRGYAYTSMDILQRNGDPRFTKALVDALARERTEILRNQVSGYLKEEAVISNQ